jgi:hypothetical protein
MVETDVGNALQMLGLFSIFWPILALSADREDEFDLNNPIHRFIWLQAMVLTESFGEIVSILGMMDLEEAIEIANRLVQVGIETNLVKKFLFYCSEGMTGCIGRDFDVIISDSQRWDFALMEGEEDREQAREIDRKKAYELLKEAIEYGNNLDFVAFSKSLSLLDDLGREWGDSPGIIRFLAKMMGCDSTYESVAEALQRHGPGWMFELIIIMERFEVEN